MAYATASSFTSNSSSSLLLSSPSSNPNRTRHSPPSHVTFRRPLPTISAVYATADEASVGVASSVSLQATSFYEVLGIQAGASGKEIKAAYRKLARVLHPDVVSSREGDATSLSVSSSSPAEEFMRVHEAYATLSDPKKRADYDRMMWVKGRRLNYSPTYCTPVGANKYGNGTTSSSGFSGYTRRTWETDQCW